MRIPSKSLAAHVGIIAILLASQSQAQEASVKLTHGNMDRVSEILHHLETFMPAPEDAVPPVYLVPSETFAFKAPDRIDVEPLDIVFPPPVDDGLFNHDDSARAATEAAEDLAGSKRDAQLQDIDFATLARSAQIIPQIGADMMLVDKVYRPDALHDMARTALMAHKPSAFRKIMAAYIDPAWQSLDDPNTALQMIAWMPDTAAYLGARIEAARIAGNAKALTPSDQTYLWKDLRARVERVGSVEYSSSLLIGMVETGHASLAVETIKRNSTSNHERVATYVGLIDMIGAQSAPEDVAKLVAEVEALRTDAQATRYDPNVIALAYWKAGLSTQSFDVLSEETDPALRLRTQFEMLLQDQ